MDKKNIDGKISDALEITSETFEQNTDIVHDGELAGGHPIIPANNVDLNKDYGSVRKNLKQIINAGGDAIEGILTVASETESPRAYEVAAQMIKNVADVNKDLIEIHNKMKQINKEVADQKAKNITNNSLFVGSTKDLQKFIKQQRDMIIDQIEDDIIDGEVVDESS